MNISSPQRNLSAFGKSTIGVPRINIIGGGDATGWDRLNDSDDDISIKIDSIIKSSQQSDLNRSYRFQAMSFSKIKSISTPNLRIMDLVKNNMATKIRLPTITLSTTTNSTTPKKSKQQYQEMVCGDMSSVCCNEKSDDLFKMTAENAMLLKCSNHTGTTHNGHSSCDIDDDKSDNEFMLDDGEPLLTNSYTFNNTASDSYRDMMQIAFIDKNIAVATTPKLDEPSKAESDHRSTQHQKDVYAYSRVSPRTLHKFRTVGILNESLEEYQPQKLYIRVCDTVPASPKNSPTRIVRGTTKEDTATASSMGRTRKVTRVRSIRGGRKIQQLQPQLQQQQQQQQQLQQRSHLQRPDPQMVLERMSFGPASKHHYRHRHDSTTTKPNSTSITTLLSQSQRSLSNYQNLFIDINTDNTNDERIDSKIKMVNDIQTLDGLDLPISVQNRRQMKKSASLKHVTLIESKIKTKSTSTTPMRERVKFDFNPKDVKELCNAIEEAKISRKNKMMSKSTLVQSKMSPETPCTKTTGTTGRNTTLDDVPIRRRRTSYGSAVLGFSNSQSFEKLL
jgi:hypothetical protein